MRFSGWENTRCQPRTGVLCVVEQNKMSSDSSCFLTFVEMRRFVSEPVQHVKHEKGQMQKDWIVGLLPSLHISQRAETSRMSRLKQHLHLRLVWSVSPDSGIGHQNPSRVQRTWRDAREHHHHPWLLKPSPYCAAFEVGDKKSRPTAVSVHFFPETSFHCFASYVTSEAFSLNLNHNPLFIQTKLWQFTSSKF